MHERKLSKHTDNSPIKKKKLGQLFSDSCRRVVQITSTILVKWEVRSLADGDK